MESKPLISYRVLFWVSILLAAFSATGLYITVQRLNYAIRNIADPRLFDARRLSASRDINYPFTIEVHGYKYQGTTGNYIDDQILTYGVYEKNVLYFMRDYARARNNPDAVFLDVGANTGQHSLFMSRYVKRVHAFEPFPPVADRFRQMIQRNGFSNIILHEVGLGNEEASVPFFAPPDDNLGGGTFLAEHANACANGRVRPATNFRVVVGDKLLEQNQVSSIELVKIDVEGYEEYALIGLSSTLARDRPVVVVEVSPPPSGTIASLDQLKKLFPGGYRFLHFDMDRNYEIKGGYKVTELSGIPGEVGYEMVVAYPKERESSIALER